MIKIIPAIDIIQGKCVRLTKGDYSTEKVYSENPVEIAKSYEAMGLKYLHVVDLEGAKSSRLVNGATLKAITKATGLEVDFGGGIKNDAALQQAFDNGASAVTVGSVAVKDPALTRKWIDRYGSDKIILGADIKDNRISINGWKNESNIQLFDFVKDYILAGIKRVISTDISRDGMLSGPNFSLYRELKEKFPALEIIASGGISNMDDIYKLRDLGLEGVIIGKAIYEHKIRPEELIEFLKEYPQRFDEHHEK
ncbi:MAG: 1-(5-phosphoribosyl)-5-[(5-phosphoribosylamino)methylideneamino]imidazole-4-carboxamide isomerase [Candidatus Marinimicrobia bacterium]|nr:1-(5-phosphoribosyl)-5-[(5-phosphoribosylamino)methylideneamino]imidazole-4-carboxamide isomerase [Candidatus Neomarinimicrobiota bacterium]